MSGKMTPPSGRELAILDRASQAIARAETVGEAKGIVDQAAAIKVFAAKQGWSKREKVRLGEIEVRATRRLGELLAATEKADGGAQGGSRTDPGSHAEPGSGAPTLADLGVSKKQSHVAQQIASIPEEEFEAEVQEAVSREEVPTNTAMHRVAKQRQPKKPTLRDANRVAHADPQLADQVRKGEVPLADAVDQVKQREREEENTPGARWEAAWRQTNKMLFSVRRWGIANIAAKWTERYRASILSEIEELMGELEQIRKELTA